jgi:hypothetical protein
VSDPTWPGDDRRFTEENLLITCRQSVHRGSAVDRWNKAHTGAESVLYIAAEVINRVADKFSPSG